MANMFRLLRADEVDARVGTVKSGKGVSLLLYKDARCDQNVLDETVGPYNWQRTHSRDNANCTVSIWDESKKQWISKEDTGTESNTEAEKGLASDSFKRACFNWGIGRELYTAPVIWIDGQDTDKLKYMRYTVKELGYNKDGVINRLVIVNRYGDTVFTYDVPDEPLWIRMIRDYCNEVGITSSDFQKLKSIVVNKKLFEAKANQDLTEDELETLIEVVEKERTA